MNWYLVYELTHFLLIIWRCRSFSTHCFHHFKKLLYDIFYFYIGIRIRKRNLKCGVSFFFFFENYEKHVIEEKKSQFISYTVNARVGLWNSTREPKFTVLANKAQQGLVQYPESCPHGGIPYLTSAWDYSSYIDTVWGRWENNLLYNLSPSSRFHQFLLSYYNRNSWIRLKAKIPKFYLCTCSLLQIDRNEKTIFFVFFGGGNEKIWHFLNLFDSPCNILHSSPTLSSG